MKCSDLYWTVKSINATCPNPRTAQRRSGCAVERCRRILQAASHHFNTHGFERASTDAIAADADVSKMTIYSNIGSKEGLFEAVVRERTELVVGGRAGAEALDPKQPQKALMATGEHFFNLTRESEALGQFRSCTALLGPARGMPSLLPAGSRSAAARGGAGLHRCRVLNCTVKYIKAVDAPGCLLPKGTAVR
jgi:AcrR family transcriptional regulator